MMKYRKQSSAQSSAPAFSFFGGGDEEHSEVQVLEVQDQDQGPTLDSPAPSSPNALPPSDFLDSITEEVTTVYFLCNKLKVHFQQVMEMPMTLPSSHTVDRSTLDKYDHLFCPKIYRVFI